MSFGINNAKLLEKYKTIWIRFKTYKVLNWMLCLFMVIDIKNGNKNLW